MGGLPTPILMLIFGAVGLVWYWFTFMRSKTPKKFLTPLYLFTRRKQVYRIDAENRGGLMVPSDPGSPGYVEVQTAAMTRRWGRVWKQGATPQATESYRKRETIYVVRENDPTPLTVEIGRDGRYQGPQIQDEEFKALSNLNQRWAAANARIEGAERDKTAFMLNIGVVVAVSGAVVAWAAFFVITILNGEVTPT